MDDIAAIFEQLPQETRTRILFAIGIAYSRLSWKEESAEMSALYTALSGFRVTDVYDRKVTS
jgi:hypothetical protein